MMIFLKRICTVVLFVFIFLHPKSAVAQQTYEVTYDFNFFIENNSPDVQVELNIHLKNLRPDIYIDEFSLNYPNNFLDSAFEAEDLFGRIPYKTDKGKLSTKVTFEFDEPDQASSEHYLKLRYTHRNLYTKQGTVQEAILPLIQPAENAKVNAMLHLPEGFEDTISISKPRPTNIEFRKIYWEDIQAQTIFTLFGDYQLYDLDLSYTLVNESILATTKSIALPPETLYQRIFIESLEPKPDKTFIDIDGNYIAEYDLDSREELDIEFHGQVQVFINPQDSMRQYAREQFTQQQEYLLTEQPLWSLGAYIQDERINQLDSLTDIYGFVLQELDYSYSRLTENQTRYGAERALKESNRAVCMEFTDLFIALAREKGIYAREIQGYGFSQKEEIRPLSLVTDVLHSWPEVYDEREGLWLQLDPTWQDTSGIDYLTGFDTNHITFAIHGKSPVSPLPAGFYKTERSKDITVNTATEKLKIDQRLIVRDTIPDTISADKPTNTTIQVTNTGNSFIHDLHIQPRSSEVGFSEESIYVGLIAPYETKEVTFTLQGEDNGANQGTIEFLYAGTIVHARNIAIKKSNGILLAAGTVTLVLVSTGALLYMLRRK